MRLSTGTLSRYPQPLSRAKDVEAHSPHLIDDVLQVCFIQLNGRVVPEQGHQQLLDFSRRDDPRVVNVIDPEGNCIADVAKIVHGSAAKVCSISSIKLENWNQIALFLKVFNEQWKACTDAQNWS